MIIDENKKFFLIEDNDDNTVTMTMYLPDVVGPEKVVFVSMISLTDMVTALIPSMDTDDETYKYIEKNSVRIPNEVED